MKKYFILTLLFVVLLGSYCTAASQPDSTKPLVKTAQDSLSVYTGKYEMKHDGQTMNVTITLENGALVALQSWDGLKKYLDHLKGDNFIVAGIGWSVEFKRDKNNKITGMLISGTDTWTRVDN